MEGIVTPTSPRILYLLRGHLASQSIGAFSPFIKGTSIVHSSSNSISLYILAHAYSPCPLVDCQPFRRPCAHCSVASSSLIHYLFPASLPALIPPSTSSADSAFNLQRRLRLLLSAPTTSSTPLALHWHTSLPSFFSIYSLIFPLFTSFIPVLGEGAEPCPRRGG